MVEDAVRAFVTRVCSPVEYPGLSSEVIRRSRELGWELERVPGAGLHLRRVVNSCVTVRAFSSLRGLLVFLDEERDEKSYTNA